MPSSRPGTGTAASPATSADPFPVECDVLGLIRPVFRPISSHSTVWGGGVGRRDLVDEAADGVLVGSEDTGPGVRRRQSALHRLTRGPVLPVGEVPEFDGVRRAE